MLRDLQCSFFFELIIYFSFKRHLSVLREEDSSNFRLFLVINHCLHMFQMP